VTINQHISTFAGLPVVAYPDPSVADPGAVAWRFEADYEDQAEVLTQQLDALCAEPWASSVAAIVIGQWGSAYDSAPPVEHLTAAAAKLPALRGVFLGEMTFEECEISWINHTDITPLLEACPRLEVLTVRGSEGLSVKPVRHEGLRRLTFESGGLPADVVTSVSESDFPSLEHLELWLGTDNYGGDVTADDLSQILSGTRLPSLRYLGLRDAEIIDLIAPALASAPVVARLEVLDLSLGLLSDVGARALLAGQPLTHLRLLDLHHHFLSEPMMQRLQDELEAAGVTVDLDDAGDAEDEDDRYIAVSE
jgi:hypothetical protein